MVVDNSGGFDVNDPDHQDADYLREMPSAFVTRAWTCSWASSKERSALTSKKTKGRCVVVLVVVLVLLMCAQNTCWFARDSKERSALTSKKTRGRCGHPSR